MAQAHPADQPDATHSPLDLVIIMLGANDMKPWIHAPRVRCSEQGIAATGEYRARCITYFIRCAAAPKVIIVSPPAVSRTDNVGVLGVFLKARTSRPVADAGQDLLPIYADLSLAAAFSMPEASPSTTPDRRGASRRREHEARSARHLRRSCKQTLGI
jgi:lysophospholipase L1-like esterase